MHKNVIFIVGHPDMLQAMRLSSVWPIDIQYQAAARGYSCVGYVKMVVDFTIWQQFKRLKKQKVLYVVF